MNERICTDFIERCKEFAKPFVEEYLENRRIKIDKWNNDNRELLRHLNSVYSKTEKGKKTSLRRMNKRNKLHNNSLKNLSKHEKKQIRLFYLNRPLGYHVDHIIPLSKGGSHHILNLQYLTPEENRKKGNKIIYGIDNTPKVI